MFLIDIAKVFVSTTAIHDMVFVCVWCMVIVFFQPIHNNSKYFVLFFQPTARQAEPISFMCMSLFWLLLSCGYYYLSFVLREVIPKISFQEGPDRHS